MKFFTYFILFNLIVFTLSGCTGLKTRQQIDEEMSAISQEEHGAHNQITQLESSMREFNGRLESLEHQLQQSQTESTSPSEDILTEVRSLKTQLSELTEKVRTLENNMFITTKTSPKTLHYLEAEDLFRKEQWQNAILTYEKYRSENPKGQHWPDATFKIGVSFERLNLVQEAKSFYTELISKQPRTSEARKAQARLRQLNKSP